MRDQRGYSILEVVASLVIVGLASFSFMDVMQLMSVSSAIDMQNAAVTDMLDSITESFADNDETCSKNLGALPFNPNNPNGMAVDRLQRFDMNGVAVDTIAETGAQIGNTGLSVVSLRLLPAAILSATYAVGRLEIKLQRGQGSTAAQFVREIPLYLYIANSRVMFCSTSPSNKASTGSKLCEMAYGGWGFYNVEYDYCEDDPRVRWFDSPDKRTATCPAGYKLAADPKDPDPTDLVCYADAKGVPVTPRRYTDGSQSSGFKFAYTVVVDWTTNSCIFTFNPLEDLSQALAQVKCVPADAEPL